VEAEGPVGAGHGRSGRGRAADDGGGEGGGEAAAGRGSRAGGGSGAAGTVYQRVLCVRQ
jgi:hypothetical protein